MRQKITNLIRAGYSGLYLESFEEARVERELCEIAKAQEFTLFKWTLTMGLVKLDDNPNKCEAISGTEDPVDMLIKFLSLPEKSIVVAADFHMFLEQKNPMVIRRLKDALRIGKGTNRVFCILGCIVAMPPEIEKDMVVVNFQLPDRDTLGVVLDAICQNAGVSVDADKRESVLDAASGLTTSEAEDAFALSVIETQGICSTTISRMKAQAVKKSGVLEIVEVPVAFESVGGMTEAKDWLRRRKLAFSKEARAYGLPVPKGVLAIGVPGTGKSLLAKATASLFKVPLIKLDGGSIFAGQVGESEANMRNAIATAEAIAPCILWVDELCKALSGSKSSNMTDGGTSARVLGTFLNWMQEKKSAVFVFATANDVSQLPPELLRKGRWDELFFVDLPGDSERAEIIKIQIESKGRDASAYDVPVLVQSTNGFTGAEIESAYNEAMFTAFEAGQQPNEGSHLADAVKATVPISKTMAEDITKLRTWSTGRARHASPVVATVAVAAPSRRLANN